MNDFVIIIDTETTNSIEQPLPYDIGYAIVDLYSGNIILERSYVVAEVFLDKELMSSAYYVDKVPKYWKGIKKGERVLTSFLKIRSQIKKDMEHYNITKVGAYNASFDNRATNNDTRYITSSSLRWFFPYGTEIFCIWNMACTSILPTIEYITFCLENGFVSEKGNIQTSAETVYRYITNNPKFEEKHMGLEDVRIETAIFLHILKSGLEYDTKPCSGCWMKVRKARKELKI